jgi:predicted RNase H-related nuclease YkuK (DUF458 family)
VPSLRVRQSKKANNEKMVMNEVKEFITAQSPETAVYLGCDSERVRVNGVWYADYALAVVVHIDSCHGCKIFGEIQRERDWDQRSDKPAMRLMNEVYKVSELFQHMSDVLEDRLVEVHLDINPNQIHKSSVVVNQAIGYIKGTCNVIPMVKPLSFAASYAADRLLLRVINC